MKSAWHAFLALMLAGCASPGQKFAMSPWMYADSLDAAQSEYELLQISPGLISGLAEAGSGAALQENAELAMQLVGYEYIVGPKDILSFTVWDHPELTIPAGEFRSPEIQGHLVSNDGKVFFPYVGNIPVAGKSLVEIRDEVTAELSRYIQNPQLDVRVASFRSQKVNVVGQVADPGFFPITDIPMTLVEAINFAGGVAPTGTLKQVRVLRNGQVSSFDVLALLQKGDLSNNLLLQDGDVVYVPDGEFFSVHTLGGVDRPGSVPMVNGRLNLAEAIMQSGGFDEAESDPSRVFVFRSGPSAPIVYWLDAVSPEAILLATRFDLQPQDVVFVAETGFARWNRVVALLLPTVQTLWQTQSLIDRLND